MNVVMPNLLRELHFASEEGRVFFYGFVATLNSPFNDVEDLIYKHPNEYLKDIHLLDVHIGGLQSLVG